jgi:short-subunit dehydrogenase
MKKVVLITGVSSGLGKATAEKFKKEGFTIVGVSRSKPDIDLDLWIKADITLAEARKHIRQELQSKIGRLDVLINNAGKGAYATWEELPEDGLRDIFELNFFALVEVTRELLPMLKEAKGSIINIASVAGRIHVPCMGAYCATKFAVCAYSDSLRAELKPCGVNVLNVTPGRVNTGFSKRSLGIRTPPETPNGGASAENFAKKLYSAWSRGKKSLVYPGWYKIFIHFVRCFPGIYDHFNIRMWKIDQ